MPLIADETVVQVKHATEIVAVVQAYFPLKRAGANWKARCPFHEEKTPSFNVNPVKQIFHCFGCHKGGDAIDFVMEYEKVDYPEAIRLLADRNGIPVKYADDGWRGDGPGRKDLYSANEWAAKAFHAALGGEHGQAARALLERRGVLPHTAGLFGIGFAPDSWDWLLSRAGRAGIPERTLLAAGLVVEKAQAKGKYYDRFRGRLMFPIQDARGAMVGFGARTMKEKGEEDGPKFVNSPETALFSKGRALYGLHLAKEEWERTGTAYIAEGYLDVVVPYQAGVRGMVATLGTALTPDHLKVLRRFVDKVVLVFDSDEAGKKAAERGLDLLLSENMDLFVAELPAGMDPDDVVMKHGADALRGILAKPREIFDFLVTSLSAKHGTETPAAKARIVEEMLQRIAQVPDQVKREILSQELSKRFGLEARTVENGVRKAAPPPAAPLAPPAPRSPAEAAGSDALACAAADPEAAEALRASVPFDRFPTEPLRKAARAAYALYDRHGALDARGLVDALRAEGLADLASEILFRDVPAGAAPRLLEESLRALRGAR